MSQIDQSQNSACSAPIPFISPVDPCRGQDDNKLIAFETVPYRSDDCRTGEREKGDEFSCKAKALFDDKPAHAKDQIMDLLNDIVGDKDDRRECKFEGPSNRSGEQKAEIELAAIMLALFSAAEHDDNGHCNFNHRDQHELQEILSQLLDDRKFDCSQLPDAALLAMASEISLIPEPLRGAVEAVLVKALEERIERNPGAIQEVAVLLGSLIAASHQDGGKLSHILEKLESATHSHGDGDDHARSRNIDFSAGNARETDCNPADKLKNILAQALHQHRDSESNANTHCAAATSAVGGAMSAPRSTATMNVNNAAAVNSSAGTFAAMIGEGSNSRPTTTGAQTNTGLGSFTQMIQAGNSSLPTTDQHASLGSSANAQLGAFDFGHHTVSSSSSASGAAGA